MAIDNKTSKRNKPNVSGPTFMDLLRSVGGSPADTPRSRLSLLKKISEEEKVSNAPSLIQFVEKNKDNKQNNDNDLDNKQNNDNDLLQNYTKAGNFFARVGGFRPATPEQLAEASTEQLNIYNQQRLAARNKGIGEMLLMLSDALGGRDVAIRALERQKLKQPKKISPSQALSQKTLEILEKAERDGYDTLNAVEKDIYDKYVAKQKAVFGLDFNSNAKQSADKNEPIDLGSLSDK